MVTLFYECVCVPSKGTKRLDCSVLCACLLYIVAMQFQLPLDTYVVTKQNPILFILKGEDQDSLYNKGQ